jgi:hypothetical protein
LEEVDNEIHVVPETPVSDAETEHRVRYVVLDTYRRFLHHEMDAHIGVDKGRVRFRADLRHPRDLVMLKHRLAKIEGVTEMQIDALLTKRGQPCFDAGALLLFDLLSELSGMGCGQEHFQLQGQVLMATC